jgi:PIN domain nuclease of toxin-antitoxin system
VIHLDTHVVVWLAGAQQTRLPAPARSVLAGDQLAASPIVRLELAYLGEVGRVTKTAGEILERLTPALALSAGAASFEEVVRHAEPLSWTRDPFDRLICGHAAADGAWLLTADRYVRASFSAAWWPEDD